MTMSEQQKRPEGSIGILHLAAALFVSAFLESGSAVLGLLDRCVDGYFDCVVLLVGVGACCCQPKT